jgi:hypothetical protein
MRDDYLMNITLDGGKGYSATISDDEWNAFIKAAPFTDLNGWIVSRDILEELWWAEALAPVISVMLIKTR